MVIVMMMMMEGTLYDPKILMTYVQYSIFIINL